MAKSSGESRKILWLMMVLLVLALSAAAVAFFMLFNRDATTASAQEPAASVEQLAPIFLTIDPFTVNLADDDYGSRLLYTGLTLKLADEPTRARLEQYMPQIRSRLLMLFSGQQASQLTSPGDKQRLADEVISTLEVPLEASQPAPAIDDVLFTEFIVQ